LDPIYLNLYLPKQDAREFALTTCGSCAAKLRISLQQGATKLPNRDGQSRGDSSAEDATDWGI